MEGDDDSLLMKITSVASSIIGSWWMIGVQTLFIGAWLILNLVPDSPTGQFDNNRFDTLRLMLAFQSVYTAPLILMSQRRIGAQDRKVLHEIDELERAAMEMRRDAGDRRIRLEEKIDLLLAKIDLKDHI